MNNSTSSPSVNDWVFRLFVASSALVVGSVLLFIVGLLFKESLPLLSSASFFKLFENFQWYPSEGSFGMLPMFLGSLAVASGALLLSLPFSVFCAVFMNFFAPPLVFIFMRRLLEVLAGIPSVIFGLWGLIELVPLLRSVSGHGTNMLAAILVLSMMIVPTMTLIIDKYLKAYPKEIYHNALALGIPVERVVLRLILPTSKNSIFVGAILGFGRAVGETMAVLMVAGNVVQVPSSLFDSVRTLTANIALEMSYAMGEHRAALFVCGLVLCILVMGLFSFLKTQDRIEAL